MGGKIRVGISGWTYPPWRGRFYPKNLSQKKELAYAASRLSSIEINGTFYSLQRPTSFASWSEAVPEDFVFSVKAPQYITHYRRLTDCGAPVANFFASGVLRLGRKLGPILWQFPPNFHFDEAKFEAFFRLLPRTTLEAARIARAHDSWLEDRSWFEAGENRKLRYAVEIRHYSFVDPAFFRMLRRRRIALVVADTAGKWPRLEEMTADFAYIRLHGDKQLYVSGYTPAALDHWARRVSTWSLEGRDVYIYFDNDAKVRAPFDAISLARRLGVGPRAFPASLERGRIR